MKDVCLEIPTGMFGLLGPNGAGKSTLMRILVALMEPTSGEVNICGYDLMRQRKEIRGVLGYLPQDFRFFAKYKTYEFLDYAARLSGMNCKSLRKNAVDEMLENVGLFDVRDRYANKLSGGMKRRLGIAQALIHHPKVIIVDEPTTGLDPQTRKHVWEVLHDLRKRTGMTVFLTTHYMEEAADADTVVIMDDGRIVAQGTPNELKNKYSGDYIKLYRPQSLRIDALLETEGREYVYEGECYRIKTKDTAAARDFVIAHPDLAGDFEVVKGDMDDVFLRATGKKLEGGGV